MRQEEQLQQEPSKPSPEWRRQNERQQQDLINQCAGIGTYLLHRRWDDREVEYRDPAIRSTITGFADYVREWEKAQQTWRNEIGETIQGIPFGGTHRPGRLAEQHVLKAAFTMCHQLRQGNRRDAEVSLWKLLAASQALATDQHARGIATDQTQNQLEQHPDVAGILNQAHSCWGYARTLRKEGVKLAARPEGLAQVRKLLQNLRQAPLLQLPDSIRNRWARAIIQAASRYQQAHAQQDRRVATARDLLTIIEGPILQWDQETLGALAQAAK